MGLFVAVILLLAVPKNAMNQDWEVLSAAGIQSYKKGQ